MDIVLSFQASDMRRLDRCDFTVTLVNDSDYQLAFSFLVRRGDGWVKRHAGILEADTCIDLESSDLSGLAPWGEFLFQCIMSRPDGDFEVYDPVSVQGSVTRDELRRESSLRHPVYSEKPALEIPLVSGWKPVNGISSEVSRLRRVMEEKSANGLKELAAKYSSDSGKRRDRKNGEAGSPFKVLPTLEVDLHIHELVDTTAGMENRDMLGLQLDTVRRTMKAHSRRLGQRIVFIHGKGDGVLRSEVRRLLKREYGRCEVQDASFQRYGFGATLVIVH